MSSSSYSYHPFHTIGAATLLLWDAAAGSGGGWRSLGKVADAAVLVSTEQAGKDVTIRGLTQPIARRNRSKRYSVSFRLLENAGPLYHELMLSEGSAQLPELEQIVVTAEVLRLYGDESAELSHPYGIVSQVLDAPGSPSASAGSTGGSIAPGTYFYWIVPFLEHNGGPHFWSGPGLTNSVGVSSGQKVTLTFTPPGDHSPDGYRVFFNTSGSLGTAQIALASAEASPIELSSHSGGGSFSSQDEPLVDVYSYDGTVLYVRDSDYSIDAGKGLLRRIAGGDIEDGQRLLVVYAYERPASVLSDLGIAVELERYRRLKLVQLAAESDDGEHELSPENWRETGLEFEFFKVNVSLNDTNIPFSEDEFSEGSSISWDCLYDSSEARVGTVRSTYRVLEQYV